MRERVAQAKYIYIYINKGIYLLSVYIIGIYYEVGPGNKGGARE